MNIVADVRNETPSANNLSTVPAKSSEQNGSHKQGPPVLLNPNAADFSPGSDIKKVADRSLHQQRSTSRVFDGRKASDGTINVEGGLARALQAGRAESEGGDSGARQGTAKSFVSANHLLNFQYDKPSPQASGRGSARGATSRGNWGGRSHSRPQRYDKNKFLQANFRFLVSDAVDTERYAAAADLMFDWDDVVQVEMCTAAGIQCPVSLDCPPTCPQITPCGHVYSFVSIMQHLMNFGGQKLSRAAPCPLCYTPIVARDLRLVKIREVKPLKVGDTATFQLLQRPKGCIIPQVEASLLKNSNSSKEKRSLPTVKDPTGLEVSPFAKYATAGDATGLWQACAEDLASYANKVISEGGSEAAYEAPAIYAALDSLAYRARKWTEHRASQLKSTSAVPNINGDTAEAVVRKVFTAATGGGDTATQRDATGNAAGADTDFPALVSRPKDPATRQTASGSARSTKVTKGQSVTCDPQQQDWGKNGTVPAYPIGTNYQEAFSDEEPEPVSTEEGCEVGDVQAGCGAIGLGSVCNSMQGLDDSADILGTSPNTQKLNTVSAAGDYYMYQSCDGQWVYLHPLILRCLLHHYGHYADCPPTVTGRIVELEDVVQSELTRKRWKFLSHLPLTGTFKLCEIQLSDLLPAESLQPFAEELKLRCARRSRRAAEERRQAAADKAAARAAAAAAQGPSAAELLAMPQLTAKSKTATANGSSSDDNLDFEVPQSGDQGSPPQAGISFACITKLGYAATGPSLISPNVNAPVTTSSEAPVAGVWANKGGVSSVLKANIQATSVTSKAPGKLGAAALPLPTVAASPGGSVKKGKKGMVLFSTTAQRKY